MTGSMFINNQRVEFWFCDGEHDVPQFATQRLGWNATTSHDYCDSCALVWSVFAGELGSDFTVEPISVPDLQTLKRGVA